MKISATFELMSQPLIVQNKISIQAPVAEVWDALVNPEKTKIYMFGCETVSDWTPGSLLLWRGQYEGKEMVFVKGYILDIIPGNLLRYTVFDPNSTMEDIPQNYLNVTYQLHSENGETLLTVTQDGFENAARGQERYQEVYNQGEGWNPILMAIKSMIEAE
jgi:uncharacterized protein YndB with AHSA1/START domain